MNIALLSIGNELLSGDTLNTNAAWIGRKVTELGCSVQRQITVPDDESSIVDGLNRLIDSKPNYLIITGGLGPTEDDITRTTLFRFVGTEAVFDNDYWSVLSERFKRFGMDIPESNRNQALVPALGAVIPNPVGSAQGFQFKVDESILVALPGVPAEMKSMMEQTVIPMIAKSVTEPTMIRTLRTTGIPESALIERIADATAGDHGCNIGYYPSLYGVDIRISSIRQDRVDRLSEELYSLLGSMIYGEGKDTIEHVIVHTAIEKHKTVSVAESCTGGLIGHRITEIPGSSAIFKGGLVVYGNEAKITVLGVEQACINSYGAVSKTTAGQMATKVMEKFGTDYGLSVTGIAGPGGGTAEKPVGLVYIGLADSQSNQVREFTFGTDRNRNKLRTSQAALNWLRVTLQND